MMTALLSYPGSAYETAGSKGFSVEASIIEAQVDALRESRSRAISLDGGYRGTLERMREIVLECSRDDWDGEGAAAVSAASLLTAQRFLEALPSGFQNPGVSLDPDGEVVFEWSGAPQRVFSISFGSGGKLSYAGLFGPNKTHGVEYITYGLPRELVAKILRASSAR